MTRTNPTTTAKPQGGAQQPQPQQQQQQPQPQQPQPQQPQQQQQQGLTAPVSSTRGRAAAPKRKRRGHGWTKKKSYKEPPPHPENYRFNPYRRYKIRGIQSETATHYTINWAGRDSSGGRFLNSDVPKAAMKLKGYAKKKKFANTRAVADWVRRKRQGRQAYYNDAPGEYDTSGSEFVTSDEDSEDEDEDERQSKTTKSKQADGAKKKGKK